MLRSLRALAAVLFATSMVVVASCGFPTFGGFGEGGGGGSGGAASTSSKASASSSSSATGTGGGAKGCSSNADCANESYKLCDTKTGMCVECLQPSDCPTGTYCAATEHCDTGCATDADCATGDAGATETCDPTTHTCKGCKQDTDCQPGTVCQTSTSECVPGCTPDHACATGRTCCSMQCVDLQADANHCGGCATPCAPPNATGKCVDGACAIDMCQPGYQDCNAMPADGCESTSATDPMNCGACGKACAPAANATPACAGGTCGLGACMPNFANCDGNAANGCETNTLTSPGNCGGCGNACMLPNAVNGCSAGVCTIASCNTGFQDCDMAAANGCEVDTAADPSNCGGCKNVCALPNASAGCSGGACTVAMCAQPFANCNLVAADGCEVNTNTDPLNCGGCAHACNLANATAKCSNGACAIAQCATGFADCDGNPANGCEVNLGTSVANCGACGAACSNNNGVPSCSAGKCAIACSAGFADCNHSASDGCEVNTTSNVNNCATCGNVCPANGGTPACVNGACGVSSCSAGKADCDGNPANGCEVNINTDPLNCGGCGLACYVANGTAGCVAGKCTVAACNAGAADCDGNPANGCEASLKTNTNCGACGVACALANATTSCATGTCQLTGCTGTFANCDGNAANGCEVNTSTNLKDCGTCGNACSSTNGAPSCSGGTCSIACAAGYGNCDANVSNGCETATTNNVADCGACGNVCAVLNGTPTCNGTTCAVASCTAPYKDCDGQYANGCETNTGTSVTNCGSCGAACTNANGTTSCSGGVCAPVCATGFGDCDGNKSNGCEASLNTDPLNCGACGKVCSLANANTACQAGTCVITSCKSGYADCDLNPANGCETPLNTTSNCGACGVACTNAHGTATCTAGACAPSCTAGYGDCDGNKNNGCETQLDTLTNCGACGAACSFPNAAASCSTGTCTLGACNAGYGNCDGNAANGCETNTNTNSADCGMCGKVCGTGTICSNGSCVTTCTPGTADCNMNPADGCEVNTTTSSNNCGGCNMPCADTQYCANAVCAACGAGQEDCDRNGANGCEATVATDPNNCGSCGLVCNGATNATGKCTGGACGIACNSGFANCDGNAGNGCECTGNICCSGACEPAHQNGLGQGYDDCSPLGVPGTNSTYSYTLATEARNAWPMSSAGDADCICGTGSTTTCVWRQTATSCAVWEFHSASGASSPAGHVNLNTANNNCYCPASTNPTWD